MVNMMIMSHKCIRGPLVGRRPERQMEDGFSGRAKWPGQTRGAQKNCGIDPSAAKVE